MYVDYTTLDRLTVTLYRMFDRTHRNLLKEEGPLEYLRQRREYIERELPVLIAEHRKEVAEREKELSDLSEEDLQHN